MAGMNRFVLLLGVFILAVFAYSFWIAMNHS
jgi:hypothetical protein